MYGEWLFHTFGILRYRAMQPWMVLKKIIFLFRSSHNSPHSEENATKLHTLMLSCNVKIIRQSLGHIKVFKISWTSSWQYFFVQMEPSLR